MAAEKAILCVLFAQCYSHCHSYEKHLITIVYEIWYINKLALQ